MGLGMALISFPCRRAEREACSRSQRLQVKGSGGPHVVHCPNHGLPRAEDALQVAQREVALVYPVQVDHVGLAELGPAGHVGSGVGYVHGEEIAAAEPVGAPDDEALP